MAGIKEQQEYFSKVVVPTALVWARQYTPTFDYIPYFKISLNEKKGN